MKVLILGPNGMLGQMAHKYFNSRPGFDVCTLDERYSVEDSARFLDSINAYSADVVLNCIGLIKQHCPTTKALYDLNARLPGHLAAGLNPKTVLVHPSTDCVFKGDSAGLYGPAQAHDAEDDYGISKSMGELAIALRPRTILVRTSIIGPDTRTQGLGLMAWFMRQACGAKINGYTNHLWNGITTLEWCKVVNSRLEEALEYSHAKLIQPGLAEPVSKYALLRIMNRIFDRGVDVRPYEDATRINRALQPSIIAPAIEQQLQEIAAT